MNTKHLALFVEVVQSGSITETAQRLYISQPAVTMQIKRLEEEVGVTLLTPHGRGVTPTDAGRTLLEYAESILSLEGQLSRSMAEYREGHKGQIIIGAPSPIATYVLPQKIRSFAERHAGISIETRIVSDGEIEKRVRHGHLDVGLTWVPPTDHYGLRVTRYASDRWICIKSHAKMMRQQLLLPKECSVQSNQMPDYEIRWLDSIEIVKRFVAEGFGYGVVLESSVDWEFESGKLVVVSEMDAWPVTLSVVTRPAERLSNSLWLFLAHLRDAVPGFD